MPKAKGRSIFVCEACGNESPRWEGRCRSCGQWNTLEEVQRDPRGARPGPWLRPPGGPPQELAQVSANQTPRLILSSAEVNRVLGGGIVPGSLVLVAGDPGIGKSTLLLRLAADLSSPQSKTLYVCGEESPVQVKMRADRMGVSGENLYLLPATSIDEILERLEEHKPALAVVDSVQAIYDNSQTSEAGSVAQVKECTRRLMEWSKASDIPIVMSGHVTKDGTIAGPRVLEHMVDVVLYMEGDSVSSWRLLRTYKNRFGSTNEVGVFEMTEVGLTEVEDPSKAFLSERSADSIGSVVVSVWEGSRPLLVEIQALTSPSVLPSPRRVASGVDFSRLLLVCAVLTRRAGIPLSNQDVVVNVTGGLKVSEPSADLALALAITSSFRNLPIDAETAAIGEVGLTGEVRRVPQLDRRMREVARLGLKRCLVPGSGRRQAAGDGNPETVPVRTVAQAIRACVSTD